MITGYGVPGFVTQSGAEVKTVQTSQVLNGGVPVKLVEGIATELAAGDTIDKFYGVIVRDATILAIKHAEDLVGALSRGYIQVAIKADDEPVRGGAVYYDPTNHWFTTTASGMVQIPAVWAADGQGSGIAEIQVRDYVPVAGTTGKVDLTSGVTGTLPITNGGTGATDAATARTNLGAAAAS